MDEYKEKLKDFLEYLSDKYEKECEATMRRYVRHLMIGALLFAIDAKIITPKEKEEFSRIYVKY